MMIDRLVEQTKEKKNPCIVGLDPEWEKLPDCYKRERLAHSEAILRWAKDVIDAVADIVPAVKPQMAFYEVYGGAGMMVFEQIVSYAHERNLIVVDDSKRNDIGNTARAYAFAHLSSNGPIKSDFLTVSPFLGRESMEPFLEMTKEEGKGVFILVKTSNPGSKDISEARTSAGEKVSHLLANYVHTEGMRCIGENGYSSIGAVVGATFPEEARELRKIMKNNYFLVPGYGAQGGRAEEIAACFNEDGLGALVSSSRGIIYAHAGRPDYDGTREMYLQLVREQAIKMRDDVYQHLKKAYPDMIY